MNCNLIIDANKTTVDAALPQLHTIEKMCLGLDTPTIAAPSVGDRSVDLRSLSLASFDLKNKLSPTTRKIQRRLSNGSSASVSASSRKAAVLRRPSDMSCHSTMSDDSADTECGSVRLLTASVRAGAGCPASQTPTHRLDSLNEETMATATSSPKGRKARRKVHPLYLHRNRDSFTCAAVSFEEGMSLEECDALYRKNKWDRVAVDSSHARPPKSGGGNYGGMLGRLRGLSLAGTRSYHATAKMLDDERSTEITASGSSSSLDDSVHSTDDSSDPAAPSNAVATSSGGGSSKPRFSISFSPTVKVHSVPSAAVYPRAVYESIWHDKKSWKSMKRHAKREWEYDYENWRRATEEDGFVRDDRTGKKVHPVHVRTGRRTTPVAGCAARSA